jgi:predicted dehydrogenase
MYLDFIERVAICDLNEERAKYIAKRFGFDKTYTDYKEMIAKENLDGVIVCINAAVHPSIVKYCLEAGLDVFVEKPAAVTPEEAKEIYDLSQKVGKFVMVDHQKRGSIAYRKALEIVEQPEFGEIMSIQMTMNAYPYDTLLNCLMEMDIHQMDMFLGVGGEIKEMHAMCKFHPDEHVRAAIAAIVKFDSGIVGTIHVGTEGNSGCLSERFHIIGSNLRTVYVDNAREVTYVNENDLQIWKSDWRPISENMSHVLDGYVQNIYNYCKGIHTREIPKPTIYDEWKVLKFIYEIADQCGFEKSWKMVIGER